MNYYDPFIYRLQKFDKYYLIEYLPQNMTQDLFLKERESLDRIYLTYQVVMSAAFLYLLVALMCLDSRYHRRLRKVSRPRRAG